VVVGSVGEVGKHLRAQATLLEGSMGPEEHWRRRSTVTGEAEEAMVGDELAPGSEVLSVSSSGVTGGVDGSFTSGNRYLVNFTLNHLGKL
jgi:hypothetical protein